MATVNFHTKAGSEGEIKCEQVNICIRSQEIVLKECNKRDYTYHLDWECVSYSNDTDIIIDGNKLIRFSIK